MSDFNAKNFKPYSFGGGAPDYLYTGDSGGGGAVDSVNGKTGVVVLDATDVGAAPTDSPAFTGTPTAPTQTPGDNSTRLATTAYADAAGGGKVDQYSTL